MVRLMPSTFDFVGNESSMSQPEDVQRSPPTRSDAGIRTDERKADGGARARSHGGSASAQVARLADERARDDPADGGRPVRISQRDAAAVVQLERDRLPRR
jgi:hypothetical protein